MAFKYMGEVVKGKMFFTVHKVHYACDLEDVGSVSFIKKPKASWWEGHGWGTLISFKSNTEDLFIPHGGVAYAKSEHNKIVTNFPWLISVEAAD